MPFQASAATPRRAVTPAAFVAGVVAAYARYGRDAQDALGKGTVELLARAGGWRPEAFLRNGKAKEGRLWDRTPPRELGLPFSRYQTFVLEQRFGFNKMTWRLWLGDHLTAIAFSPDGRLVAAGGAEPLV